MSTTTATKPSPRKPAAKPAPKGKATPAPKEPTKPAAKEKPAEPETKTLVEALTTGQTVLLKIRANSTRRSLPYLAVGTEQRKQAEAVAKMREQGQTVDDLAEALKVSTATARRSSLTSPSPMR